VRFAGRAYKLEDLERIAALGLDCAEINLHEGGNLAYREKELLDAARRWNLRYLVHAPNEGRPTEVERLGGRFFQDILRLLDACTKIHASLLTVHFWMDGRFISRQVSDRKRAILWDMAREGQCRGVRVCMENLSERPEDLAPTLEGCPELSLTLDIGHGQLMSPGNRALDFIRMWPHRIGHVHAHDNRGGSLVGDDLHLPIGEGIIDFPTIMPALVRAGYDGTVTLEVPLIHMESSLGRLRRIIQREEGERPPGEVIP
jgi:sugar phosphate isomerase/epimerase